jgi:hypothetical protein
VLPRSNGVSFVGDAGTFSAEQALTDEKGIAHTTIFRQPAA